MSRNGKNAATRVWGRCLILLGLAPIVVLVIGGFVRAAIAVLAGDR
jgi:hypothetical protein